ncbi:nucleoside diphosphate kinase, mitochondrial isoform X2 [Polyodon spathula]|uniref:nucleoside diphosphate kinase, mitochondrial isoform X2 n=1 Tax=Polyodon spathula TaxID=7913 RepID=UPI001B7E3463|nr:nucleoside diphosphate kinase, mitochondrial isoform X2 [Polyodon spathula]
MVLFRRSLIRSLVQGQLSLCAPLSGNESSVPAWCSARSRHRINRLGCYTTSVIAGVSERTLIAVKPDGVQRRLVGQIVQRFEQRGFKLVGIKLLQVWEGHNVVRTSRLMVGNTNPAEAYPGTIRGDYSVHISRNVIHASDSVEGAQREIQLWFDRRELVDWDCCDHSSSYQA